MPATPAQWYSTSIDALLLSPHIQIAQPPAVVRPVLLGTGPVDLFSSRFENLFADNAQGVVAGQQVSRDSLKETLLAIQKNWDPSNVKYTNTNQDGSSFTMNWCSDKSTDHCQFAATASSIQDNGVQKINSLNLDGDQSIFHS